MIMAESKPGGRVGVKADTLSRAVIDGGEYSDRTVVVLVQIGLSER